MIGADGVEAGESSSSGTSSTRAVREDPGRVFSSAGKSASVGSAWGSRRFWTSTSCARQKGYVKGMFSFSPS